MISSTSIASTGFAGYENEFPMKNVKIKKACNLCKLFGLDDRRCGLDSLRRNVYCYNSVSDEIKKKSDRRTFDNGLLLYFPTFLCQRHEIAEK